MRLAKTFPDQVKNLFFDVHVSVCGDDDGARIALRFFQLESALEGRQKLGAPAAPLALDEMDRLLDVFRGGRQGFFGHHRRASGEEQNIKSVGREKVADQILQQLLRDFEREAVHGTRNIDNKNVLAAGDVRLRHLFRGLHHEQEKIFPFPFVEQEPGLDPVPIEPVAEDVIPVAPVGFRLIEPDAGERGAVEVGRNFVGSTVEILYGQSRGNVDPDIESIMGRFALVKVGVLHPSF